MLGAGHVIEALYVTEPERWPKVVPSVEIAKRARIPIVIIRREELEGLAKAVRGRICLSVGFAYVLPKIVIDAASLFLNVHGTLLPKYRGARTLNWVIASGDLRSGVTVHKIDEKVDTGPILYQREFPVSNFDTGASLARKTYEFEPSVVLESLGLIETGKAEFRPQGDANVRDYPDRVPEHSRLDPLRPLSALYNDIRAADPEHYPAHFYVEGQKVCVRLWRPDKPADENDMI